jgi:hypothetical protein
MSKKLIITLALATLLFPQANTWTKTAGRMAGNGYMPLLLYSPETKEYVLNFGELSEEGLNCLYQVLVYDPAGRWINALPHDSLYGSASVNDSVDAAAGNWADSTGYAYGNGRVGRPVFGTYFWTWGTIDGYLRPSSVHTNARVYGQGCYNSDDGKFYYYLNNITVSYDPATRLFDTISVSSHPNSGGLDGFLKWGSMVYDAYNQEILLFGGGALDQPYGSPMTCTFNPATRTWTRLSLSTQPGPRANAPMVYDPVNQVIVLFGGDHMDYCMNDTWIYHCATRTWEKKMPAVSPKPRAGHGLYYLPKQGKIALMGGYLYSTDQRSEFEIWTYDVSANTWGLVKRFASGDVWPKNLTMYSPMNYLSACDTGDNIIALADTAPSIYNFSPATFRLACDASTIDAGGTATYGSRSDTVTYRTDPHYTPAWCTEGVAPPDTAANEAVLRGLPLQTWTLITPPKSMSFMNRTWGTTILDTDRDQFIKWSGGHVAWCGTNVDHYRIAENRWAMSYVPEFPMEWNRYNNPNPGPFTFSGRPFMPVHTVKSYAYDVNLHKMVYAYNNHTWIYDPDKMDWDSVNIHNPWGGGWGYRSGIVNTPHGAFNWFGDAYRPCRPYLFDTTLMNWRALPSTGDPFPGFYADANGVAYDSQRDRVLYFGVNTVYAYSFGDSTCTRLYPADSAIVTSDNRYRDCVYLPNQDVVLIQIRLSGGNLAYDCAANRWISYPVTNYQSGMNDRGTGLMYDPKRNLVWLSTAYQNTYVMRPDSALTGIARTPVLSEETTALAVSPNPFNPAVSIRLKGGLRHAASLKVFDLCGRLCADLSGRVKKGRAVWNASGLASGVYVLCAEKGKTVLRRKIVLSK